MAESLTTGVWDHKGRPAKVTGSQRVARPMIGGKSRGTYDRLNVEYLDGKEPRIGHFGLQTWGSQAKRYRGAQKLVWERVRDLVDEGMKSDRAQVQAMAELNKGVLDHPKPAAGDQEAVF